MGISYKRFLGWEPTEGDSVEWDETEREWMRSLAAYEQTLCPLCGLPRDVCQSPDAELKLKSDVHVCWATAHMQIAADTWRKNNKDSPVSGALALSLHY